MGKILYAVSVFLLIVACFACAWLVAAGEVYECPWYDVDPVSVQMP